MTTYILLIKWTERGQADVKDTVQRSKASRMEFERRGIRTIGLYWLQGGPRDAIMIVESPDEQSLAAATLAVKSFGYIRIETLRAFTEAEMEGIVADL